MDFCGHNDFNVYIILMRAFTLIELLVVIGIILVIFAVLFPAILVMKVKVKSAQSLSNISQIGKAWYIYADDNNDRLMPFAVYHSWQPTFWWASYNGNLDYSTGILSSYINNIDVNKDPLFTDHSMDWIGYNGFGYNYFYLSPTVYNSDYQGINYSEISNPASTLAFGTTALSYKNLAIGNPYFVPTNFKIPTFQGRVNDKGVVIWCDLHANYQNVWKADSNNLGYFGSNDNSFRN